MPSLLFIYAGFVVTKNTCC